MVILLDRHAGAQRSIPYWRVSGVFNLLDLSAAFDTVTHDVMLDRLKSRFGITGDAQQWIASYLEERY